MSKPSTAPASPIQRLLSVALLVTAVDALSKVAAESLLSGRTIPRGFLSLALAHNTGTAFGLTVGAYTWQLNVVMTIVAMLVVIPVARDLSKVDRRAPLALGLIVGGAAGNLLSLATSSQGVVDFIAVQWQAGHALIVNLADVAAYAGLVLIIRTGFIIARELREEGRIYAEKAAPVSSLFAEKALAKRQHREEKVVDIRDRLVADWNRVGTTPSARIVADRHPARDDSPRVLDLGRLRPSQVEEMTRPLGAPSAEK